MISKVREDAANGDKGGAAQNEPKNHALTAGIPLTGPRTPIGNSTTPFRGKFYGNGHTITIESGFSFADADYTGIFGYAAGSAEIRDLTVAYKSSAAAGSSAVNIGGIMDHAGGTTTIRNCIVSGASGVTLTQTGASGNMCLGGMAGYMATASIVNCRMDLDISNTTASAATIRTGGVVGRVGTAAGGTAEAKLISGVEVTGEMKASGDKERRHCPCQNQRFLCGLKQQ
ncbi:MAG: hypothetical protein LBP23_08895 [Treponema sp.]|nr:hypothetical protein [Treponema sp.]